jgi:hypothetical protein
MKRLSRRIKEEDESFFLKGKKKMKEDEDVWLLFWN